VFRAGQTFVAAAYYAESSPNTQNLKPKPQGVPHPVNPANVPLKCSDSPLRTAADSRVVAYTVHLGHLRGQTVDPLVQLGPMAAKQLVEVTSLLAVTGGHRSATSASHGDTLTKGKPTANQ
jgi:hypothetical protein